MALTKKEVEEIRKSLKSRGTSRRYSPEEYARAYLEHGTLRKTAEALGVTPSAVQMNVHRALKGE